MAMETGVIVLSIVVGLFGMASAVLGFIAEATKLKPNDIDVSSSECVYPANPAFALGLCAVLLLAAAQIIASASGGCCGCCRPRTGASESKRVMGTVASVLSWIAAVIAGVFYLQGAAWNAPVTRDAGGGDGCYYLKGGVFTRAAVLSLVAASLGINSYIVLRAPAATSAAAPVAGAAAEPVPKPDGQYPPVAGVAAGLPQWPAQGHGHAPYYPHPAQGYGQVPNAHFAPPPQGQADAQV